ncbi:MAG: hypothetical protein NTW50_01015 [Candidatus Berkelbacteria bacterium]|nr:hypothetical protein [Candidatus Berkelbacteria bacterium]
MGKKGYFGGGTRRSEQVHQTSHNSANNYHSGPRTDGSGGRFISSGSNQNHTTNLYNSKGTYEGSKSRGDGGPNRDRMRKRP